MTIPAFSFINNSIRVFWDIRCWMEPLPASVVVLVGQFSPSQLVVKYEQGEYGPAFAALANFSSLRAHTCLNSRAKLFWSVWCGQERASFRAVAVCLSQKNKSGIRVFFC